MRNLRLVHSDSWFEHSRTGFPSAYDATEADPSPPEPRPDDIDFELPALNPAVQAMVERVRIVESLPAVVRARALARARAAVAALRP